MFQSKPLPGEANAALCARDIAGDGCGSNVARPRAWRPGALDASSGLRMLLTEEARLPTGVPAAVRDAVVCGRRVDEEPAT
jgi:hypothetical protein